MIWFTIATVTPVLLLALAAMAGGLWCLLAVVYMTCFVYILDRLVAGAASRKRADGEFPVGQELALFLGGVHFVLLVLAVAAIAGATGFSLAERLACLIAFGLFFGQVSNANAHELIHKQARWPRRLGKAVYISLLFGHHASAHTRVHHVWAASAMDPNSPAARQSFYRFWPRAWAGSFVKGLRAENALRARRGKTLSFWSHPYLHYVGGGIVTLSLAALMFGAGGVVALLLVTSYAQVQLLLSDYVQHYGLSRKRGADGRLEPVGPEHSWNARHFYSSALMLNAPRHSDHHMHPLRTYPALDLDPATMPVLPYSLPVMAVLALWPRMWRRVMDPRVAALRAGSE